MRVAAGLPPRLALEKGRVVPMLTRQDPGRATAARVLRPVRRVMAAWGFRA